MRTSNDIERLRVGLSTCPNDTFLFHGLLSGAIPTPGLELEFELLDIEELNLGLLGGRFDVAKGSFALALERAAAETGLELPELQTRTVEEVSGHFDHAWVVSVFNDPEAFPALHDALYGRTGELATGRGNLDSERRRAEALAGEIEQRQEPHALLTVTGEELPMWRPVLARAGRGVRSSEVDLLTAVVGDPLRFLHLGRPGA